MIISAYPVFTTMGTLYAQIAFIWIDRTLWKAYSYLMSSLTFSCLKNRTSPRAPEPQSHLIHICEDHKPLIDDL